MKLYHGSNIIIEQIDLSKCKPFKDFGQKPLNTYTEYEQTNAISGRRHCQIVKEVIRRVTLWMENRVKPDYTQMSIEWSRKNNSYPDTPSGDPVAVSLKVLKKHF